MSAPTLEFRVLGPLQVCAGGRSLSIERVRTRRALALLLVHANEVVLVDWLIDGLWADRPPRTALASLHNVVCELRALLGREHLERKPSGYRLGVEAASLDANRFEQLQRQAAAQPPATRLQTLKHALALWRGLPYADVFYDDFAQPEIKRLEELRLTALESICAATLHVGDVAQAVPQLQSLVEQYPYREAFRRQLMTALTRSGRPVEALLSYQHYETKLAAWQTQPGAAIAQTAQAIKDGDYTIRRPLAATRLHVVTAATV